MAENTVRMHAVAHGRVQGVWFRAYTERIAVSLGLTGWVRNLPDGSVEAVFEGRAPAVNAAVAWMHEGPERADVDNVDVTVEPPENLSEFRVR